MKLAEALQGHRIAELHVDGPSYPGTHIVSRSNSSGYYHDFRYDDKSQQPDHDTNWYYPSGSLSRVPRAEEDGWTKSR